MSGRAYARNPSGALGGATDIDSFVPHHFRIEAPQAHSKAKELAIRRAIQRRCKEKNWKKLLRVRHTRLVPLVSEEPLLAVENGVAEAEKPEETKSEKEGNNEPTDEPVGTKIAQENGGDTVMADAPAVEPIVPVVTEQKQQEEAIDKTKQQLLEMEEKLATLSAEKHAKFQQLKDILIAEGRSKAMPPMPKKRRVDSLGSVGTGASPGLAGAVGGIEGAGLSLLGAPSPSLLRAQSFSGTASFTANDGSLPYGSVTKDARRQ